MTDRKLAEQYFTDLPREGRVDSEQNLRAWLWHTCPATRRDPVEGEIWLLRAERLRQRRLEAGYTQQQLAELAGVTVGQLSRIERGLVRPHRATIAALTAALAGGAQGSTR